jgi:hypothetical protein
VTAPARDRTAAVLALQQAAGNQAVNRALRDAPGGVVQRDDVSVPLSATAPTTPAIAAESDFGAWGFGGHATLYLARLEGAGLVYYKIDLWVADYAGDPLFNPVEGRDTDLDNVDWLSFVGYKLFGMTRQRSGGARGVRIEIKKIKQWPTATRPGRVWSVSAAAADRAYDTAVAERQACAAGKYYYSPYGLGVGGHNCASMASVIVRAAGVDASSGVLIHTPAELALGSKLPDQRLG